MASHNHRQIHSNLQYRAYLRPKLIKPSIQICESTTDSHIQVGRLRDFLRVT